MLLRQLFDLDSSTYTYLLADRTAREAVLIDPVFEQFDRDRTLISELELKLLYVLETHVHADHVTSAGMLREQFGAKLVVPERSGVVCAEVQAKHGDRIRFGRHALEVRETPGHTSGCVSYHCAGQGVIFTGDALLVRACGRTDFQDGDAATLFRSVREQIFSLPDDVTVFPAHDYKGRSSSSVGEERKLNPRLNQSKTQEEFVRIMSELKLPYPRKLDIAVPANVRCGLESAPDLATSELIHDWAPITISRAGVPELTFEAVQPAADSGARLVDVRESDEYRGELGHIPGAQLVPLSTLGAASRSWQQEQPVLLVCRSGARSGKAALQLAAAGFKRVASLQGGMLQWNAQKQPIQRGYIENRQG